MRLSRSAFTLVELLIGISIVGMVSTAATAFYVQSMKTGYTSEQQMKLITTMRSLTNEMIFNGSRAHELILYNSTAASDRTPELRKVVVNEATETSSDDICPTGNFVVFIYYELPKPAAQAKYRIAKLIGYYLDQRDAGPAALTRITIDLTEAPSTDTVETILTNHWTSAARRVMAPRITPLALSDAYSSSTPPQLFYKRANQNIAVCGQLLQSAKTTNTNDWRTYTRSFYFSVTVRS